MQVPVTRGTLGGFRLLVVAALVPVLFIGLRLASVDDWPGGWVLAPIWIPALLAAVIAVLCVGVYTLVRWFLMARALLRSRSVFNPELALADPSILSRIEAERPVETTSETSDV